MGKGSFDSLIDDINKRDKDDTVGLKKKKTETAAEEASGKKKKDYSMAGMLDKIRERDDEKSFSRFAGDPTENLKGEKEEKGGDEEPEEKPAKKKPKSGIDSILDGIRERDRDDTVGLKKKD